MNKIIMFFVICIILTIFVNATYTPDDYTNISIVLEGSYTPDDYTNISIVLYEQLTTCTCPGLNQDWEIDMAEYCVITDDCDLGTGNLNFTGVGNVTCNATINTTNLGDPGLGVLFVNDGCVINVD